MSGLAYKPAGDVLKAFMRDDSFVRGIRGPVGSGKSVGCGIEIFRRALEQKPGPDGIKRTRWGVVRNSYPELRTTTIKTWLDWFPEETWGKFLWNPPPYTHRLKRGDLDIEVLFLALDRPDDVKKLLSLELTGIWINEAREVSKTIVDACTMRVGRFPSARDGGATWYGVIMDTNAPDDDHWWPILSGEAPPPDWMTAEEAMMLVKPADWKFFDQPPGMIEERSKNEITGYTMNPKAENANNLPPDYYRRIITGKDKSWIDVYVMNKLGSVRDGRPVYPEWNDSVHLSPVSLDPVPGIPLIVGVDFGLTPAAAICQSVRGKWAILRELVASDMGATRFAQLLKREMATNFPGFKYKIFGDPAGDQRAQTDEQTPFQILRKAGLSAYPAPSNDVALRTDAVKSLLNRLVEGQPGLIVDPACPVLIKGFRDSYAYRRLKTSGEKYTDTPDKNRFSHVHDAMQYAAIGGGEGRALVGDRSSSTPKVADTRFSVFDRQKQTPKPRSVRFSPLSDRR